MERRALEASWAKTREHLARAHAAFDVGGTAPEIRADVVECIDEYIDELSHNELELEMDALAEAALRSRCSSAVWQALASAASNMALADRAEEFRRRAHSEG